MKYEPYHALINAIILQAVKDYRTALDDENTSGIRECERFFRSDWFTFLTDVDGGNHYPAGSKRDNTKKINNRTNTIDR